VLSWCEAMGFAAPAADIVCPQCARAQQAGLVGLLRRPSSMTVMGTCILGCKHLAHVWVSTVQYGLTPLLSVATVQIVDAHCACKQCQGC
jgi:hypothetical protein